MLHANASLVAYVCHGVYHDDTWKVDLQSLGFKTLRTEMPYSHGSLTIERRNFREGEIVDMGETYGGRGQIVIFIKLNASKYIFFISVSVLSP